MMSGYVNNAIKSCLRAGLIVWVLAGNQTFADESPLGNGWVLDTASSNLTFQTIKNGSKLETSSFASYQGTVDSAGNASLRIQLDSVDTKVDLRNVRMRFLFFETFKYAEAFVTTRVDPALVADLSERKRVQIPVEFELDLHGIKKTLTTQVVVTALAGDQVSVASVAPISIPTSLFGLDEGVRKLEEAAEVTIVPMGSVSFNLVFNISPSSKKSAVEIPVVASVALESSGEFSEQECVGRFEILSRTRSIYFRSGSADLDTDSDLILAAVADIIQRCPSLNIIIAGHTDSAGSESLNQQLSEMRSRSVVAHLVKNSVDPNRMISVGYGESRPVVPNDTPHNRERNRRIEFQVNNN